MFACLYFTLEVLKTFSMVHFTGVCIYVCMCSTKHLECSSVLRVVVLLVLFPLGGITVLHFLDESTAVLGVIASVYVLYF